MFFPRAVLRAESLEYSLSPYLQLVGNPCLLLYLPIRPLLSVTLYSGYLPIFT